MRKGYLFIFLLLNPFGLFAQNEVGPEGQKLVWVFLFLFVICLVFFIITKPFQKLRTLSFSGLKKVKIGLEKDTLYYPDTLTLTIKNNANKDIDVKQPLLIFDNFWLKRKFRIKGIDNRVFYPLYLEKGKTHTLKIDLSRFYGHDKKLKRFPKAKVILTDVNGKKLGSKSVYLRKTLLNF